MNDFWQKYKTLIIRSLILIFLSYKYYDPFIGGGDDFSVYYSMYENPLSNDTEAPRGYRLFGATVTHLIYKANIYYHTEISFQHDDYDQRIFFAALLSNYIALLLCGIICSIIVGRKIDRQDDLFPFIAGILCFLSFHTQYVIITGINDGWSWFLVALAYLAYERKSILLFSVVMVLTIIQREIIPLIFLIMAIFDFLSNRKQHSSVKFEIYAITASLLSMAGYLLIRTIVFPLPGYEFQYSVGSYLKYFVEFFSGEYKFGYGDFFLQSFVTQNILILFLITSLLKMGKYVINDRLELAKIGAFLFVIIGLSIGVHENNNTGRMINNLNPVMISLIVTKLYYIYSSRRVVGKNS
jgi:hypothetical protein